MRSQLDRLLTDRRTVTRAAIVSFAIGLTFIFVWAPHPWGWEGTDRYHDLARALARGQGFATLIVPWGYAAFLAVFYRLFGDHPAVPLVAQAALNATIPLMLYRQTAPAIGRRAAVIAAIVVGLFSFNTVYASSQLSDSVCNVVFVAAILLFVEGERRDEYRYDLASGALAGVAAQFRPNLILIPFLLAGFALWRARRLRRGVQRTIALLAVAAAVLAPWTVRNYRLTGLFIPASVHGGAQLWYGSLQMGPYLRSRPSNPRAMFEAPTFASSSLTDKPLIVGATRACTDVAPDIVDLVYWTDRTPLPKRLAPARTNDDIYEFEIPASATPVVVYYYFDIRWPHSDHPVYRTTPPGGDTAPFVFFVTHDHLGDLDVHGDLLDIFDVIRLARHIAWGEPLPWAARLDSNHDGVDDLADLRRAIARVVVRGKEPLIVDDETARLDVKDGGLTIRLRDGSTIDVPRTARLLTDVTFVGGFADRALHSTPSFAGLGATPADRPLASADGCLQFEDVSVNRRFDRTEPQMMRRYFALAKDNIRRDPMAYLESCAYRAIRLFVIEGSADRDTAQQFAGSRRVYRLGEIATLIYLALFGAGVVIAVRRRLDAWLFLGLIAYVPATICFVLINMRYSVTVQPYIFVFAALAIEALLERLDLLSASSANGARGRDQPRGG